MLLDEALEATDPTATSAQVSGITIMDIIQEYKDAIAEYVQ